MDGFTGLRIKLYLSCLLIPWKTIKKEEGQNKLDLWVDVFQSCVHRLIIRIFFLDSNQQQNKSNQYTLIFLIRLPKTNNLDFFSILGEGGGDICTTQLLKN